MVNSLRCDLALKGRGHFSRSLILTGRVSLKRSIFAAKNGHPFDLWLLFNFADYREELTDSYVHLRPRTNAKDMK